MQEPVNVGELVLHHTSDQYAFGFEGIFDDRFVLHWHKWHDVHIGGLTLNFTPTKQTIFMMLGALLVFLTMRMTVRGLARQRAHAQAPKGFPGAMEALVLFVRNDIAIANIGHDGPKFAPLVLTLFFFVLYMNLLGLLPWGGAATANLAVTAALAVVVFLVVEISGMRKLGFKGYMGTIFVHIDGLGRVGGMVASIFLAPIELVGKFTKGFALAIRLFGTMVAGHFVILSLFGIIFLFGHLSGWNYLIGATTASLVLGIMALELFVAFLQAYVFALLTATFIGMMQHEH
jgi:F-type H+-transporting ATPase subunit a